MGYGAVMVWKPQFQPGNTEQGKCLTSNVYLIFYSSISSLKLTISVLIIKLYWQVQVCSVQADSHSKSEIPGTISIPRFNHQHYVINGRPRKFITDLFWVRTTARRHRPARPAWSQTRGPSNAPGRRERPRRGGMDQVLKNVHALVIYRYKIVRIISYLCHSYVDYTRVLLSVVR